MVVGFAFYLFGPIVGYCQAPVLGYPKLKES